VDDVTNSGRTLDKARTLARKAGAAEVQAAVLVIRPGGVRPEWHALETDELVVFGWDYQLPALGGSQSGGLDLWSPPRRVTPRSAVTPGPVDAGQP